MLRKFFQRDIVSDRPELGTFTHLALWQEVFHASGSRDELLMHSMREGFPLLGPVERSQLWPCLQDYRPPVHDLEALQKRAWGIRRKVEAKVIRNLSGEHSLTLWKDTLEDVQKGFSEGPYFHEDQVSDLLGTSSWIAMPRFPVVQGTKVRPVDDGSETGSEANLYAAMTEKLAVPSIIDQLVAATRDLKKTTG